VNLVCSPQPSASLTDSDTLRLPTTFFINSDCLIDELALPAALVRAKASAAFYRACLVSHGVQLVDGETSLARDTYFAFPVPEPSFEDRMVLRELLARGALSRRLALCLLMLDFPNPVFSEARSALLRYTPEELRLDGGGDLDERFSAAVRSAVATTGVKSPEARFLDLWDTPDEERDAAFAARVEQYWTAVQALLISNDGFDAFFRLAESRRRQFRSRPIAEFGLTLPVATRIDVPPFLEMTENATVRPT
jgi:hypothetical protein